MEQTNWVDFREVKQKVSMRMVLDHYGVTGLKAVGDSLRGKCPLHEGEGVRTFQASLTKNIFHCFSCKAGGNVLDFVAAMDKVSVREAAVKLQEWFLGGEKKESTPAETDRSKVDPVSSVREDGRPDKQSINPLLFFQLRVDSNHEYGQSRGLSQEIILQFGCGLCLSKGMFANRYVIPLHNPQGELVGYAGRALQEELLCRHFQKVILMLDADEAGRKGIEDCLASLSRRVFVKVVTLPEGKQPDMLTPEQLEFLLKAEG
jgi:DNA primase